MKAALLLILTFAFCLFTFALYTWRMSVLEITEFPEKVLKQAGAPVEEFGAGLERLASDMFETMYAAEGVGLVAPQVGLSLRLFVMDCEGLKLVAANPEILSAEGEQEGE